MVLQIWRLTFARHNRSPHCYAYVIMEGVLCPQVLLERVAFMKNIIRLYLDKKL